MSINNGNVSTISGGNGSTSSNGVKLCIDGNTLTITWPSGTVSVFTTLTKLAEFNHSTKQLTVDGIVVQNDPHLLEIQKHDAKTKETDDKEMKLVPTSSDLMVQRLTVLSEPRRKEFILKNIGVLRGHSADAMKCVMASSLFDRGDVLYALATQLHHFDAEMWIHMMKSVFLPERAKVAVQLLNIARHDFTRFTNIFWHDLLKAISLPMRSHVLKEAMKSLPMAQINSTHIEDCELQSRVGLAPLVVSFLLVQAKYQKEEHMHMTVDAAADSIIAGILGSAKPTTVEVTDNVGSMRMTVHAAAASIISDILGSTTDNVGSTTDNVGSTTDNVGSTTDNVGSTTDNVSSAATATATVTSTTTATITMDNKKSG